MIKMIICVALLAILTIQVSGRCDTDDFSTCVEQASTRFQNDEANANTQREKCRVARAFYDQVIACENTQLDTCAEEILKAMKAFMDLAKNKLDGACKGSSRAGSEGSINAVPVMLLMVASALGYITSRM